MTHAVIICGGRVGHLQAFCSRALDAWHGTRPIGTLIHGQCSDRRQKGRFIIPNMDEAKAIERDGGDPGWSADMCGDRWARRAGVPEIIPMPANWYPEAVGMMRKNRGPLDRGAGMKRNRAMAERLVQMGDDGAHVAVLAFAGGNGTDNMIETAAGLSLPVWRPLNGAWRRVR